MNRFYKIILAIAICDSALLITQKIDGTIQKEWWEVFIPIWCAIPVYFIITSLISLIWYILTSRDISVDEIFDGKSYVTSLPFYLTFPLMFMRYENMIVAPWKFILIPYLPLLFILVPIVIIFLVNIPSEIKKSRKETALKRFPPKDLEKLDWDSMKNCLNAIRDELSQFEFTEPKWDISRKFTIETRKNGHLIGSGFYFRDNEYAICTYIYGHNVSQFDIEGFTLNSNNPYDYYHWLSWSENEYSESRLKEEMILRLKQLEPYLIVDSHDKDNITTSLEQTPESTL